MSLDVAPLSHTPPTALKAYSALVTRLKKALVPLLGACRQRGGVRTAHLTRVRCAFALLVLCACVV